MEGYELPSDTIGRQYIATGGHARWGSALEDKSFSVRWWKCSMRSMKKTSLGSHTDSALGANVPGLAGITRTSELI